MELKPSICEGCSSCWNERERELAALCRGEQERRARPDPYQPPVLFEPETREEREEWLRIYCAAMATSLDHLNRTIVRIADSAWAEAKRADRLPSCKTDRNR